MLICRIVGRKHPEDDHHPDCHPVVESVVEAQELDRQMRSSVRESDKRPRDAYTDAVTSISKRFQSSRVQADVIGSFPSFGEVRRQLNRHRIARNIPVSDVLNIPEQLRVTLRGSDVLPDDVCFNERFLLQTGLDGRLLVFCADTELLVMHDSEYLICDGTFEMSLDSSYQLYAIHGFCHSVGMALAWALFPNKTTSTNIDVHVWRPPESARRQVWRYR